MGKTSDLYNTYVDILREELVPAFGCTEPISVAYCAACARELLGCLPQRVEICASGNIIKNVKSVIVPNTGGLKGLPAAAAAGIIAGKTGRKLEVIAEVTEEEKRRMRAYLEEAVISVKPLETAEKLDLRITVRNGEHSAAVRISQTHCNIVYREKDGKACTPCGAGTRETMDAGKDKELGKAVKEPGEAPVSAGESGGEGRGADRDLLNVRDILAFAEQTELEPVRELLDRQIAYNLKIAREGMEHDWGANIGSVLAGACGDDVRIMSRAMAAAGSDARMGGCELPVVINSGSGNQGITVSVPVIVYAEHLGASREELYRALLVSNLIAIHIKHGIGPLSAFCGAVSAGCAAGCGIAWLHGGREEEIAHTLVNSLAMVSGIFCDGAKASCAAKIASSVEAGILGWLMYRSGQQFYAEDGIVSKGVEQTIQNICRLGAKGMNETDEEIIRIMTHCD